MKSISKASTTNFNYRGRITHLVEWAAKEDSPLAPLLPRPALNDFASSAFHAPDEREMTTTHQIGTLDKERCAGGLGIVDEPVRTN